MKTTKYIILFISSLLIFNISAVGQSSLKKEVIIFMENYEKYSSFTKDGLSFDKSYGKPFRELFEYEVKGTPYQVFNDIEEGNKPPYVDKIKYQHLLKKNFPKGINVDINITEIGKPKKIGKYNEVEVKVSKNIYGLNKEKKIIRKELSLTFKIRYSDSNVGINNLKIIRISAKGFPRSPSGLSIGINIQPSSTNITTEGFLNEDNTYVGWSEVGEFTFSGGLEFNYYLHSPFFGIGARINYTSYQSTIELNSYTQASINQFDIDNDNYSLYAYGNAFNETVILNYLEIPVFVKIRLGFDKTKFLNQLYINLGPVFSFSISNTINTNGTYTYKGYYPEWNVELYDIPRYGFYTDELIDSTPTDNLSSLNLSGLVEIGANIPLIGDKLNMNFSFIYQKGLLNLSKSNDDFNLTYGYENNNSLISSRSSVSTSLFGVNIGILYKIF